MGIFGVNGWRWEWARDVPEFVFAFDADTAGARWRDIARQALLRGKRASFLPHEEAYGGCQDVAEAWVEGTLDCEVTRADIERAAIMEFDGRS